MTADRLNQIISDTNQFNNQSTDESMQRMAASNEAISKAIEMSKGDPTQNNPVDIQNSLLALDSEITRLNEQDTAKSRQDAQLLSSVQSTLMDKSGYTKNQNPVDQVASVVSNTAGVTSDLIGTVVTGIEAVGAADNIAKTMVRGVANTKDVDNIINNVQKFIELGGKVAGSVASVTGLMALSVEGLTRQEHLRQSQQYQPSPRSFRPDLKPPTL